MESYGAKIISQYESSIIKMILMCVSKLEFPVGISNLIGILRGSKSTFVRKHQLYNNEIYSLLNVFSKGQLSYIINLLISCELLKVKHVNRNNSDLPVIEITTNGRNCLVEDVDCGISFIDIFKSDESFELNDDQQHLFDKLRVLRHQIAKKSEIPAFFICNDEILFSIVRNHPDSSDELLEIRGIGPKFVENYGADFIDIISKG